MFDRYFGLDRLHVCFIFSFSYTLLQIKIGEITYPAYNIPEEVATFCSREEFLMYTDAVELEKQFYNLMEAHDYTAALLTFKKALIKLKTYLQTVQKVRQLSIC